MARTESEARSVADGEASTPSGDGWISARTGSGSYRTEVTAGRHTFVADEPGNVGGGDSGPTPYDYLLGALGACTTMTLRMYASRKGWPLEEAVVRVRNSRSHAADCEHCETETVGARRLERQVELKGPLTDEQRKRLLAIADRCPVKQVIERGLRIEETR